MNILGRRVVLRAIEADDLVQLHAWSNDPALWHLLGGWHFPTSLAATRAWFDRLQSDHLNQRFAITLPETGLIGTANLTDIDWKNSHAFHGMMIGDPSQRRQGLGRDTIMAVMRYAFQELNLSRLESTIIEYNEASLGVYCKTCGWNVEGRQRDWYFRSGRYWDRVLIGLTKSDYLALSEETRYWDK